MTSSNDTDATFGKFKIDAKNIFYRSEHSLAFVNLRPIVPGHVLVIPKEPNALLSDIPEDAYDDLWRTVRKVQSALKDHYDATAFNVAVQDGRAAGQSVPHAHVHILPRTSTDAYAGDDAIYEELEQWAPREDEKKPKGMEIPASRQDRTADDMAAEAASYRPWFDSN